MLTWLVTRLRSYGAITLVALFAICVIMPPSHRRFQAAVSHPTARQIIIRACSETESTSIRLAMMQ